MHVLAYTSWQLISGAFWLLGSPPVTDEPRLVCDQVRLMTASGVIGPEHRYTFTGHCYRNATQTKTGPGWSRSVNVVQLDFTVLGKGRWERKTGTATEELKFSGSASGTRFATGLGCSQDPWLRNPPGGLGSCQSIAVQAKLSSSGPIPNELIEPKILLLARQIALAEAQALSKAAAPTSGNPPPLPPTPVGPAQALRIVEAEYLFNSQHFQVSGGRVGVQPMARFGSGWSGNAQLLWMDGSVGSVLDLIVDFPVGATYKVELYMTRAPDYGNFQVKVDGKPSSVPFMGFSPKVGPAGAYNTGNFWFAPGPRRVSLLITGKYPQSQGYLVGIDRVVFTRVGS